MTATIILIGPISAGKSTVAKLLAEKLGVPRREMDELRWDYYAEIGYDHEEAGRIATSEAGMMGLITYWKPYEAHAVKRAVEDHTGCVIDFGAGHSVYDDGVLFAQVQAALAPIPDVFLLLPSPDLDESISILNARFTQLLRDEVGEVDERLLALNAHLVRHPSNQLLAKHTIYTNDQSPEDTCATILDLLER